MKIELKNIKHSKSLSEETPAYTADIWVDGKKAGTTRNSGHGGPDLIQPHELEAKLNEYALTLPHITFGKMSMPESAETVLHTLLQRQVLSKRVSTLMKTKVVFIRNNKECYTSAVRPKDMTGTVVLNDLPFEEAVDAFIKCGVG